MKIMERTQQFRKIHMAEPKEKQEMRSPKPKRAWKLSIDEAFRENPDLSKIGKTLGL